MQQIIGIDIAKDTLGAYRQSDGQRLQVRNDRDGHRALLRWIGQTIGCPLADTYRHSGGVTQLANATSDGGEPPA